MSPHAARRVYEKSIVPSLEAMAKDTCLRLPRKGIPCRQWFWKWGALNKRVMRFHPDGDDVLIVRLK